MLGFSIYLNEDWSEGKEACIRQMAAIGMEGIFTSLQLPEDDPSQYRKRLAPLLEAAKRNKMKVMIDVSGNVLRHIGLSIDDPVRIIESGINGLRIDAGASWEQVARLSNTMTVGLNASTLTEQDYEQLKQHGADFSRLEAWHNYYPRPGTGLDENWFYEKNKWLKSKGFSITAFAPGDGKLRFPLYESLPTLEIHRHQNPLAAICSLLRDYAVDHAYIGDPGLTPQSRSQIREFFCHDTILLHATAAGPKWRPYIFKTHRNRLDVAKDAIRSEQSRTCNQKDDIGPENNIPRHKGSITLDNNLYARYKGELQITKRSLPADKKVNVIGQIAGRDLPLLDFIGSGTRFKMTDNEGENEWT
ncbi:MAG: MupG family TIM beta-alpha barrel fold protein, partial [Heyndrickxia coagulans]|uniref:DUF871 domain-containing protein n=2 Tax=Bacillota TaxID=1239 RepID=A0A150JVS9_HEYCO|nr:MupG family TIM beta-alpha barrel fold protein [Heyndrickxia coagulans]KYC61410.1 hypothetical protein B4098_1965 [Heyndrickxia coagulans]